MKGLTKLKVAGLVMMVVAAFSAVLVGVSQAASSGYNTDPAGDTTGGTGAVLIDLTSFQNVDDATNFTYAVHTATPFSSANVDNITWNLDLSQPANGSYLDSEDACILAADAGGVLRAQLFHGSSGCSGTVDGTADATVTAASGGSDVSFSFLTTFFRQKTGFSGTTYRYKVTSTDATGHIDAAPNTGDVSSAGPPLPTPPPTPSPTPCSGCATAQATQTEDVTVTGVLSIVPLTPSIHFGTLTGGSSVSGVAVGELDYTNTLFDAPPAWNVTLVGSDLTRSGGFSIPASNETFVTTASSIAGASGSSGGPPVKGAGGALGGAPVTVATAPTGTYGTWQHTGNTLTLNVPASTHPGTYNGTLTYTITG